MFTRNGVDGDARRCGMNLSGEVGLRKSLRRDGLVQGSLALLRPRSGCSNGGRTMGVSASSKEELDWALGKNGIALASWSWFK